MDYLIKRIKNPEKTEIKVFNEYINNEEKKEHVYSYEGNNIELTVKEKIGLRLLENDLKNKLDLEVWQKINHQKQEEERS